MFPTVQSKERIQFFQFHTIGYDPSVVRHVLSCKKGHTALLFATGRNRGRDSIRTKVLGEEGVGFGEGEGKRSSERFPSPSPIVMFSLPF